MRPRDFPELLLEDCVFKSHRTGEVGNPLWVESRYPLWGESRYPPCRRYDMLQGLLMLARAGALPDERANDALALPRARQQPDGLWHLEGAGRCGVRLLAS